MLVNNIFDFYRHVTLHRRRVYQIGMSVDSDIRRRLAYKLALAIHDLEKYPFLYHLYKYYGGKGKRSDAIVIYMRMNALGDYIKKICLKFLMVDETLMYRINFYEKLADVVDRHCDPVALEEFNLSAKKPIEQFLSPMQVQLSKALIYNYPAIVKNLTY